MTKHVRVLIIGGGAMGVSALYHLAKLGWSDVALIEKNELTAGSTWHAAGLCTHFAHNATIMEMRATSVRLYRDHELVATHPHQQRPGARATVDDHMPPNALAYAEEALGLARGHLELLQEQVRQPA